MEDLTNIEESIHVPPPPTHLCSILTGPSTGIFDFVHERRWNQYSSVVTLTMTTMLIVNTDSSSVSNQSCEKTQQRLLPVSFVCYIWVCSINTVCCSSVLTEGELKWKWNGRHQRTHVIVLDDRIILTGILLHPTHFQRVWLVCSWWSFHMCMLVYWNGARRRHQEEAGNRIRI